MGKLRSFLIGAIAGGILANFLSGILRDGDGNISTNRVVLAFIVLILFFWLLAVLLVLWVIAYTVMLIANALFVRGDGRDISGEGPFVRKRNIYRLLARATDYLIIAAPILLIMTVAESFLTADVPSLTPMAVLAVGLVYFPAMNLLTDGLTIGKALFGLRITSTRLSIGQLVLRELIFVAFTATMFPVLLYVAMKNEGFEHPGDIIADTQVKWNNSARLAGLVTMYRRSSLRVTEFIGRVFGGRSTTKSGSDAETQLQNNKRSTTPQTNTGSSNANRSAQGTQSKGGASSKSGSTAGKETDVWTKEACPRCGSDHPPRANHCPDCGADLTV